MLQKIHKRKAISTVLTTLIILVASVVLGTGVVLYGTSLFQTNAQSSSVTTTGTQVWVDSTQNSGWAWGAADVRNSGDKLLSVDSIQLRGQQIPFANWYADKNATQVTTGNLQSALNYTQLFNKNNGAIMNGSAVIAGFTTQGVGTPSGCANTKGFLIIQLGSAANNKPLCLQQQAGPVSLAPGEKAIIYFEVPKDLLTAVDAGSSASVALYAGQVGSPVTITLQSK
ncbi:hypothetical protein HY212_06190 [Candidatus Pacearchaeota archaeon]|nr:hypothetical protein [Candidatus Pacearchaeota archaeon]